MRTVMSAEPFISATADGTSVTRLQVRIVRSPFNLPNARIAQEFVVTPAHSTPWTNEGAVRARGTALRSTLFGMQWIGDVLLHWSMQSHQRNPLYIQLSDPLAESINWEVMHDGRDFYALNRHLPIARLTDPLNELRQPPRYLSRQVRWMSVISACGIGDQRNEWRAIREALLSARDHIPGSAPLTAALRVMVGATALRDEIAGEIARLGMAGFCEVELLGDSASRVVEQIVSWAPNLLHFFCHGFADEFSQFLELAKASDYIAELERGTVRLGTQELQTIANELGNPWCVVLNCCSSAAASPGVQSLACRVVEAGFPCAVAMVEPVTATDAYVFTSAFYPQLLRDLRAAATVLDTQSRASFEWSGPMHTARVAIVGERSLGTKEWVMPVMYVRGLEPFAFERAPDIDPAKADEFVTRSKIVADWLKTAGGNADAQSREQVIHDLLGDVPAAFRPRADGSYSTDPLGS